MPPQDTIYTPKELATKKAKEILSSHGFNDESKILSYEDAEEILVDLLLQQK